MNALPNIRPHVLLLYDAVPDFVERRAPFRGPHLAMVNAAAARGDLVLAGALGDPAASTADGAALVFRGSDPSVAERFARADPYVTNGLVTTWRVRRWDVVASAEGDASR